MESFEIWATDYDGNPFYCFAWRGNPDTGIQCARIDAFKNFWTDLTNFRAVAIDIADGGIHCIVG